MDAPPITRHPRITNLRKPIWLRYRRKKPAGVNRRAVSSATRQKDSRYRDFYSGRIVNVNRLPEQNRYTHTE
jgi:hypothetical protein